MLWEVKTGGMCAWIASFIPRYVFPYLQVLIALGTFFFFFCILQVIKNWMVRRPGNEASYTSSLSVASFLGPAQLSIAISTVK